MYVSEQNPSAGRVVEKDTKVELITEPIGNNPEVREKWEKGLRVGYGDVAITFKEMEIYLSEDGKNVECIGHKITDYEVKKVYLYEADSGVEYHDYVIEDDVLYFKDIPKGINFELYVLLQEYEECESEVILSSQNMIEDVFNVNLYLTKSDDEIPLPTTFYVADGSRSTIMDVKYLSNVKLWVQWPNEIAWRGAYFTNEGGQFEYAININESQKIKVRIINPFQNDVDYECDVTLYDPEFYEANPHDIIFLNEDGTCEVINTADYFMW